MLAANPQEKLDRLIDKAVDTLFDCKDVLFICPRGSEKFRFNAVVEKIVEREGSPVCTFTDLGWVIRRVDSYHSIKFIPSTASPLAVKKADCILFDPEAILDKTKREAWEARERKRGS